MARGSSLIIIVIAVLMLASCSEELNQRKIIFDRIAELANPGPPPPDSSNKYIGDPAVEALGKKFYFDTDFSGYATEENILMQQGAPARAARGERIRVACVTCHDLDHGGADPGGDFDNRVSVAAGSYDVNAQPSINSAYFKLVYWNGRNDSLWSQIVTVLESRVSMFGSRMRVAWRIADAYRDEYNAAFPDHPIPDAMDSITAQIGRLEADGTCKLNPDSSCPEVYCHETETAEGETFCLPRFPLEGLPGFRIPGVDPVLCHFGTDDPLQPFGDAFDCTNLVDRSAINRIYINFAKAIAAYEYTLIMVDSPFDRWVSSGFDSTMLDPAAQRGARLFVGKAACAECHDGPILSDGIGHNVGVPQAAPMVPAAVPTLADCPAGGVCDCVSDDSSIPRFCFPNGIRDGLRLLQENGVRRDSPFSDDIECANRRALHNDANHARENPDECDGLVEFYPIPVDPNTRGQWRTPSLRNVALTGPYMHNGMYDSLRDVVEHYNNGAADHVGNIVGELDEDIVPLNLTDQEIDDLVAFMEALTGAPLDPSIASPPTIPPDSPFPAGMPFLQ